MAPGPHAGNRFRPAYSSTPRFEYPPLILDAFSPRPPLPYVPPAKARRLRPLDGVAAFMASFEEQPSTAATAAATARAAYLTPARKRQERAAKRRAARREAVAAATAAWEAKQQRLAAAAAAAADGKKGGSGKSGDDAVAAKAEAMADGAGPTVGTAESNAAPEEDDAELLARMGNLYNTVFVANLAPVTTERILRRDFEAFGPIVAVRQPTPPATPPRLPRPYAFIEYASERDAREAYKSANGRKLDGRRLVVDMARGGTAPGWRPRRLMGEPPPPLPPGGVSIAVRPGGVIDSRGRGGGDYRERDRDRDRLGVGEYRRGVGGGGGGGYDAHRPGGGGSGGYDRGAYERLGGGGRDGRGIGRDGRGGRDGRDGRDGGRERGRERDRDRDRNRDRDGGRDGREHGGSKGGWTRGGSAGGGLSIRDRLGSR